MTGDEPMFFQEEPPVPAPVHAAPWEILVVDDDEGVHALTKLVFRGVLFEGRPLRFHDAFSGRAAEIFLESHPDLALVLLDVVMEDDDTGLRLVRYLRETLKNSLTRVILRTGQPGFAPEERIIVEYDINDYKEKSELTRQKLFTSVVTALRSYRDLVTIHRGRIELRKVVQASAEVLRLRTLGEFCEAVLGQLRFLVTAGDPRGPAEANGFAATFFEGNFVVRAASGRYADGIGRAVLDVAAPELFSEIQEVLAHRAGGHRKRWFIVYLEAGSRFRTVVCIDRVSPVGPTVSDLVQIFNFDAGLGMNNLFLNQEVAETQRELIFQLGELVESRSKEPGNHVRRVSEYVAILYKELGYSAGVVESVSLAAAMHDIGKIGIPDRILTKPDLLDDEEFAVMKTHTTIGYELMKASPLPIFHLAAEIALNHHERWDGLGYPRGLKGLDIPLEARVTSIVEVFDALTNKRDYHHPWEVETALAYLGDGAGKAFDPEIIALFFRTKEQILQFRERG